MASGFYNSFFSALYRAQIDFSAVTLKVALVSASYVFDENARDSDEFFSDISGEISGTGYTAGGAALANVTVNDAAPGVGNNRVFVDADNALWASTTLSGVRGAVLYVDTGTPSTSRLIRYLDFGTDQSSAGTPFEVRFSQLGILDMAEAS